MASNEKGISLVEVMAAVTLTAIIIGVAIMLFNSVNLEWNATVNKFTDDSRIRLTTNALTKYLSDANAGYRTNNELRFTTYADGAAKKKSLYLNGANLYLYDFNSANLTDNVSIGSPGVYTNGVLLAGGVNSIKFMNNTGTAEIANPNTYSAGSLVKLDISFQTARTTVTGKSNKDIVKSMTFKLLQI
ncbi:PilW family protein [Paenibacillus thalictri]|nr:prepilin-type N-terminal cleavage/methylation domain-containing protein [Paenibacillus thalictri]